LHPVLSMPSDLAYRTRTLKRARDPGIAPRSRQRLAGLIDLPMRLAVIGTVIGAAGWRVKRAGADADPQALRKRLTAKPTVGAIVLFGSAAEVIATLGRSPGQRVVGIRVADAKTGAAVTLRQAIILALTPPCKQWLIGWLTRRLKAPERRVVDHAPAIEELKRIHAGDREATQEALVAYFREQRAHPLREVLPRPLAQAALQWGINAMVRRRWPDRSLEEVLAGTVVVVDR
jgi:hypothetical protein